MASLSYYHRYVKHQYTFPWSDRGKWFYLLQRFHITFASDWTFFARDPKSGKNEALSFYLPTDSHGLKELDKLVKDERKTVLPHTNIKVVVSGTAFWGAMPNSKQIDWTKLPAHPKGEVPKHVEEFTQQVCSTARTVGIMTEGGGYMGDWTKYEMNPIPTEWFPYIIRTMRSPDNKRYKVKSLYYAPSVEKMYVTVQDITDTNMHMTVAFDPFRANSSADVPFDLDDGFGGGATNEMTEDYQTWCGEHNRDPHKEVLKLLAPYDVMFID